MEAMANRFGEEIERGCMALVVAALAVMLVGVLAGIARGDDAITPDDQTVVEETIDHWRYDRIRFSGGPLARDAVAGARLLGYKADGTCAFSSDSACQSVEVGYARARALAVMRAINSADLSTQQIPELLFEQFAADKKIGAGVFFMGTAICGGAGSTAEFCDVPQWVLNAAPAKSEKPTRRVENDAVEIEFHNGYAAGITGNAARITDGEVCATESTENGNRCGSAQFGISDRATVESIIANDGTSERLRRRLLREGQGNGLPSGTLGGGPL